MTKLDRDAVKKILARAVAHTKRGYVVRLDENTPAETAAVCTALLEAWAENEQRPIRILVGDEAGAHIAEMFEHLCEKFPAGMIPVSTLTEIAANVRKECGGWTVAEAENLKDENERLRNAVHTSALALGRCKQHFEFDGCDLDLPHEKNEQLEDIQSAILRANAALGTHTEEPE